MPRKKYKVGELVPRWTYVICCDCNDEFLYTRTMEREMKAEPRCDTCEAYDKGYKDGFEAAKEKK